MHGQKLGRGSYSEVERSTVAPVQSTSLPFRNRVSHTWFSHKSDTNFAIKRFKKGSHYSTLREMVLLSCTNHPHITRCVGTRVTHSSPAQIDAHLELAESDLHQSLKKNPLGLEGRRRLCSQLLSAVVELHERLGVIHRDIKPHNILVFPGEVFKLADLGMATLTSGGEDGHTETVVTLPYRAPEVLLNRGNYDDRVDVWSLGAVLLYVLAVAEDSEFSFPLNGEDELDQLKLIVELIGCPLTGAPALLPELPVRPRTGLAACEWSFLSACLAWRDQRPTARELLQHPYVLVSGLRPRLSQPPEPAGFGFYPGADFHLLQGPVPFAADRACTYLRTVNKRMRWVSGSFFTDAQLAPFLRLLCCVSLAPGVFPKNARYQSMALACYSICSKLFGHNPLPEKVLLQKVDECGLISKPIRLVVLHRMISHLLVFSSFRFDLFGDIFLEKKKNSAGSHCAQQNNNTTQIFTT